MAYNGPAVGFSKRYPTTAPPQICPGGQKAVTPRPAQSASRRRAAGVQGGFGACFCHPGTNLNEHYACRGTSMIGAGKLSRYGILIGGTGAVSRYRLSRSQKTITMQDLYWGQVSVSGFKILNEFFWPADCQGGRRLEKKKNIRAHTQHPVFAQLAYTSPGKNRDKLIDPTVRVSSWLYFIFSAFVLFSF